MTRTYSLRLVLIAFVLWPSLTRAQAKDAFVDGLTQLINVVDGTYGDEGPQLTAAVEAMSRGLAAWDARVAGVESGFRADVAGAAPAGDAGERRNHETCERQPRMKRDALAQY
jgi:hypothetical protein